MYPKQFFETLWRPNLEDRVFVAMPFSDEFNPIWQEVIVPGIQDESGAKLDAYRVNATVLSGSVITDILNGVAHARLIMVDISAAKTGQWMGQRNGNVMYELGLAHATRLPEEVILIRSDDNPIAFDIAGINVHRYDDGDYVASRKLVGRLVRENLTQLDRTRSLQVERVVGQLDGDAIQYLEQFGSQPIFKGPNPKSMGEELISISNKSALVRLQSMGILTSVRVKPGDPPAFIWTEFGKAVVKRFDLGSA